MEIGSTVKEPGLGMESGSLNLIADAYLAPEVSYEAIDSRSFC